MSKTSITIFIMSCFLLVSTFALLCIFPWQIAVVIELLFVIVLLLYVYAKPNAFLKAKEDEYQMEQKVLMDFEKMLKEVFVPDTLLVSTNTSYPYRILIDKSNYIIGREDDCDFVLPLSQEIGRHHVAIQYNSITREYAVCDLSSQNGTYLNGEKLPPNDPHVIQNGDIISITGISFQVRSAYE